MEDSGSFPGDFTGYIQNVVYTGFGGGNLRERGHLDDTGVDGRIILKMDIQEMECGGMDWFRIGTDGGHL